MISAEPEWPDVYAYAQVLLDRHAEHRALIDEIRRRADGAESSCGDLLVRDWNEVEDWGPLGKCPRPVQDYQAAVLKAARFLGLGNGRADVLHELAGRSGYELKRPLDKTGPPAPAAHVASAIGADGTGEHSWRSGATANRQARYRYLSTTASRQDRPIKFHVDKERY